MAANPGQRAGRLAGGRSDGVTRGHRPEGDTAANNEFSFQEREALYRIILLRRDVRSEFTGEPIPRDVLRRILLAAHLAPSVGFMQPWNFLLITDLSLRREIKLLAETERHAFAQTLPSDRSRLFARIKVEGILESSMNICVTCDGSRAGPHVLGKHSIPETAVYSACLAVGNLWLAARAEGIGVGWVSFYRKDDLRRILGIPKDIDPLAYLCVGPVSHFQPSPDLEQRGWQRRLELPQLVFENRWGNPSRLFEEG